MAATRKNQSLTIRENKVLCPGYCVVTFDAPVMSRLAKPGQFCLLSVGSVFLRRPLSIYDAGDGKLGFLYRVIGKGTKALAEMKKGEALKVMGTLGKGYDITAKTLKGRTPLLVAGGTGIASLHFLAAKLGKKGVLFYGARSRKDFVCVENFRKLGWKIALATEDGSAGTKGYVTDLLDRHLAGEKKGEALVYTCGPHGMMKKVAAIAQQHGVPGFVSLEEMMACGVGNCQGCAVKTSNGGYKMVCKDGPVFAFEEIAW